MRPASPIHRALFTNPGPWLPLDDVTVYARDLEVPSGGGVVSARGLARAYGAFAAGGAELRLGRETLEALAAPAVPPQRGFYDECVLGEVQFSLGFMKPSPTWQFGGVGAFGSPGSGGSLGYADPETRTGYAYVTNRLSAKLTGDPRDVALRKAMPLTLRAAA
jgi:CubicO group peptidase (beta-lactamase class C family)